MHRSINRVFWSLRAFTVLCLALMVVLVFGNVVLRYGFNSSITVSEELSRWAFIWMIFTGAIGGLRDRAHLGVDSLVERLPRAGRLICFVASHAVMAVLTAMLMWGCLQLMNLSLGTTAPVMGLSMGWYFAAPMVFCAFALPLLAAALWRALSGRMSDAELISVRESEENADLEAIRTKLEADARELAPEPASASNGNPQVGRP